MSLNENQNFLENTNYSENPKSFWIKILSNDFEKNYILPDYLNNPNSEIKNLEVKFEIPKDLASKLIKICKKSDMTLFIYLLAAVKCLIYRYTDKSDITCSCPPFYNYVNNVLNKYIVIRNEFNGDFTFKEVLMSVKDAVLKVYKNQDYPIDEVINQLGIPRGDIFDTICILKNIQSEGNLKKGTQSIGIIFERENDRVIGKIIYNSMIYAKNTIVRFSQNLINIIDSVTKNPNCKIGNVNYLSPEEEKKIIYEFNKTEDEYIKNKTISKIFEEQVEKYSEKIAIVFGDKQLSYRELNERANQLARTLKENNVDFEDIVSIMVERNCEMIISILGTLKAGCAYLPIDTEYPSDRVNHMLQDSGSKILITQKCFKDRVLFKGKIIFIEDEYIAKKSKLNIGIYGKSRDLAYLMYTSGTTGKPKGVMVEQINVLSYVNAFNKKFNITPDDSIIQQASFSFDHFVEELYPLLLCGGKIVIIKKSELTNMNTLYKIISKNNISIVSFSPLMLNELNKLSNIESVRLFLSGGDVLKQEYISNLLSQGEVYNTYGPTETTVCASYYKCGENMALKTPIGKPIFNYKVYILDKNKFPVPIGVPGEIYISGDGVTRGYFNNFEMTREKFVDNPYESGLKMYKSGDLGRWLDDGNIEFLGRVDTQVKIRGYRIELGELESQILKIDHVREVVVVDKEDVSKNKYLCAYIVSDTDISEDFIKDNLKDKLPDYMIPSFFIRLDKMPLTFNGFKIDRKALPDPVVKYSRKNDYVEPRNNIELKLVELWSEILAVDKEIIGVNTNFFELGGQSIKVIQLVANIYKEFQVELPITTIFDSLTIKELANIILKSENKMYSEIDVQSQRDYYEISSPQNRLYILSQLEGIGTAYNIPIALIIESKLDINKFQSAFSKLIERHESLRTSFKIVNGKPMQKVNENIDFNISYSKLEEDESIDNVITSFIKPFNLSNEPLFRAKLVKLEDKKHLFIFDIHHIISDGISISIIIKDLIDIYEGNILSEPRIHYKDFAAWQNKLKDSDTMLKHEEYWLNKFKEDVPILNMMTDFERPNFKTFDGSIYSFEINKVAAEKLNDIALQNKATLFIVLMSLYNILLWRYTGQNDIVVGTPISGRSHPDSENIVGMFVNTLAIRSHISENSSFGEFLASVKEDLLNAYEHQDYQFDELVSKLNLKTDLSRNPVFDTVFKLDSMDFRTVRSSEFKYKPYDFDTHVSRMDFSMEAIVMDDKIVCNIEYSTHLFKPQTIERFSVHFNNIISEIINDPKISLSKIEMISKEEKEHIASLFNDTEVEYTKYKTIHEIFEEQVKINPNNIALVFKDKKLTYMELNEKSNQLANILRNKNVIQDSIVGIMVERSCEMIIGLLGVLKAGGAYLPIDPKYPEERINYMLKDSGVKILLTQKILKEKVSFNGEVIYLDDDLFNVNEISISNINAPSDLAYVIYTSGSTGNPKGVMIEHKGLANLQAFFQKSLKINSKDKIIQFASFSFDASVWEIFMALLTGATLHLLSEEIINDFMQFESFINQNGITIATLPPSYLMYLNPERVLTLKKVIAAGAPSTVDLINKWKYYVEYINAYGPTETTICATTWSSSAIINEIDNVTIGKPIANTKIYIAGDDYILKPIGVIGEIFISSIGVARGYLNRIELTKEKFIENPFETGDMVYKTGDLGRYRDDGNIEFLGRADQQVKIRGYRIELGEIESVILKDKLIKEVCIIDMDDLNGDKYLYAYFRADIEIKEEEIKDRLIVELPSYMIPSYFIQVEKMPLTPSGKIDRKVLLEQDVSIERCRGYIAPTNDVEKRMAKIWEEVFSKQKIGITDDFFALGGHSLIAVNIVSKIYKEFNINIPISQVFKKTTIKLMGEYIISKKVQKNL